MEFPNCTCEQGHALRRFEIQDKYFCSKCECTTEKHSVMFTCYADDYDLCETCYVKELNRDQAFVQRKNDFLTSNSDELEVNDLWHKLVDNQPSLNEALRQAVWLFYCYNTGSERAPKLLDRIISEEVTTNGAEIAQLIMHYISCFATCLDISSVLSLVSDHATLTFTVEQQLHCLVDMANFHSFTSNPKAMQFILEHIFTEPINDQSELLQQQQLALNALGNLALAKEFVFPSNVPQQISLLLDTSEDEYTLKLAMRIMYSYSGGGDDQITTEFVSQDELILNYPVQLVRIAKRKPQLAEYALNRMSYFTSQPEYTNIVFKNSEVCQALLAFVVDRECEDVQKLAVENLSKALIEDVAHYAQFRDVVQLVSVDNDDAAQLKLALTLFEGLTTPPMEDVSRAALKRHEEFIPALLKVILHGSGSVSAFAVLCAVCPCAPQKVYDEPNIVDLLLSTLQDDNLDDYHRQCVGGALEGLASYQPLKTPLFRYPGLVSTMLKLIPIAPAPVALRCVRVLGFLSWENCNELFYYEGLMSILLDIMRTRNDYPELIEQSANVLGNLALEDELRGPLFNFPGLLTLIIDLLLHPDPAHTKSSLLRILQQVSIPFKFEAFRFARLGEMICTLLDANAEVEKSVREECLEFCCHLSSEQRNKEAMLHFPSLFAGLVRVVERKHEYGDLAAKNALITIAHLAWENRVEIATFPRLLDNVVDCLKYEDFSAVITDHAATICNNLALEEENHVPMFHFPGLVPGLLEACVLSPPTSTVTKRWANAALVSLTAVSPENKLAMRNNKTHMHMLLNAVYDGELTNYLALFLNIGWTEQRLVEYETDARVMLCLCGVKFCVRLGVHSHMKRLPMHLMRDLGSFLL